MADVARSRTKRTVDPKKVVDVATWLKFYKTKYGNLVYDAGSLRVLDPKVYATDYTAALAAPVKTFELNKAVDAYRIVEYPDTYDAQLRVAAEERLKTLDETQDKDVQTAKGLVDEAEKALLKATDAWGQAADLATSAARSELAMEVAKHTRTLEEAEATLQRALYPVRRAHAESGLLRNALNFATHDTRKVMDDVYCVVLDTSKQADRIIPFVAPAVVVPAEPNTAPIAPVVPNTASVAPVVPNTASVAPVEQNTASVAPVEQNTASAVPNAVPVVPPAQPEMKDIVGVAATASSVAPPTKRRITRKKKEVPTAAPVPMAATPVAPTAPVFVPETPAEPPAPKMLRILT
jgi:hypothetical protein